MSTPINDFLVSLVDAVAAATGIPFAAAQRGLWAHEAIESASTPVFTVLRVYGGTETASFAGRRRARARIQADTRGKVGPDVLHQAWMIHEALLDADGRPQLHWSVPGKRINDAGAIVADGAGNWLVWVCDLPSVPGVVGRDEQNRVIATDNFEVEFVRVAP